MSPFLVRFNGPDSSRHPAKLLPDRRSVNISDVPFSALASKLIDFFRLELREK
jgi:hypothetical protein